MSTATELLRRVMDAESHEMLDDVLEDIRTFLEAEEERKPKFIRKKVCWNCGWPIKETKPEPARKPMTEEELQNAANFIDPYLSARAAFKRGVRFAEKHHGIGGDDE